MLAFHTAPLFDPPMSRTIAPAALSLALAALSAAHGASAQTAAETDARRLAIQQAQEARAANDHQRALDFALRAGAVGMTPSLREFIAQESSALGLVGEALRAATLCEREATANHTINNRDTILNSCRAMIANLRPRVGYVIVHADAPPAGLQIRVAGQPLNVILLDADYAVTPGDIAVDATAPGSAFETHVTIAAGAHTRVDVQLHPVATASVESSSSPPAATSTRSEPPSASPTDNGSSGVPASAASNDSNSSGILRPLSFASLGVGAALVVGSIATLSYFYAGVVAHCTTAGVCETDEQAATATSLSMPLQIAGYTMLGVGAALAVAGTVGIVMTGHSHTETRASRDRGLRIVPIVGSTLGVSIGAQF